MYELDVAGIFADSAFAIIAPFIYLAIGVWIFVIVVYLIKIFVKRFLNNERKYNLDTWGDPSGRPENISYNTSTPYILNPHLLTKREADFFDMLRPIAEKYSLYICIKPRMADFISVTLPQYEKGSKFWTYFNHISAKHIDFLLIDKTSKPIVGFELDDKTHQRSDRAVRDLLVKDIYKMVGLKTFHLLHYSPEILEECIHTILPPIDTQA